MSKKFVSILLCLTMLLFTACADGVYEIVTSSNPSSAIQESSSSIPQESSSNSIQNNSNNSTTGVCSDCENLPPYVPQKQEKSGEHPILWPEDIIKYFKAITGVEIPSFNRVNYYGRTYASILEDSVEMVFDASFHNNYKEHFINNLSEKDFICVEKLNRSENFYYNEVLERYKDEEILYFQKEQVVQGQLKYIRIAVMPLPKVSTYSQILVDCVTVNPLNYYYPINEKKKKKFGKPVTNYLQGS